MGKVILCKCKTSKDCINYVQTGNDLDFSCIHYVNPKDIEDVNTGMECINYVTEAGLSDYKAVLTRTIEKQKNSPAFMSSIPHIEPLSTAWFEKIFGMTEEGFKCKTVCPCCYEECEECDCMDYDDFYTEDDISDSYNEGYVAGSNAAKISYDNAYQAGYDQGYEDACLDECDDEEDDFLGMQDLLNKFFEATSNNSDHEGILPEDKGKPIYIAVNKTNPLQVFSTPSMLLNSAKVLYSDNADKLAKFISEKKPDFVKNMIIMNFDVYKKSYETEDNPIDPKFLYNIKFDK